MQEIRIIFISILFITNSFVFCQNHLDFIPKNNKKRILSFNKSDRIGYAIKGFSFIRTGELQEINDSTITVSGKTIQIADLTKIGHRKRGNVLISIGTAAIGGFALGYLTLSPYNSTTQKVVGLSISIPMFTFGQIISLKNRVYNLRKKYTYKVST
jgi:hypothetical protein